MPPLLGVPPEEVVPPEPELLPEDEPIACRHDAEDARAVICVRLQAENWLLKLICGAIR